MGRSVDEEHSSPSTSASWIGKADYEMVGEYLQRLSQLANTPRHFNATQLTANVTPYNPNGIGSKTVRIVGGEEAKEHRTVESNENNSNKLLSISNFTTE